MNALHRAEPPAPAGPPGAIRVLFVQSYTGLGGAESALAALVRHLPPRIAAQVVLLGHGNGELVELLREAPVPVAEFPAGRFREWRKTLGVIRQLRAKIVSEDFSVVVSNGAHPHLYARPAALWARRPSICWVHDLAFSEPLQAGAIAWVQQLVSADILVANSNGSERVLRQHYPAARIEVIPPGIDLARLARGRSSGNALRASLGIPPQQWVVGMFARLQRWKGHQVFLRAAARMVQAGFSGRFLVVGNSTPWLEPEYPAELHRLVQRLRLADRVLFLGGQRNVHAFMSACNAVVHASVQPEPYGLVVAEAMSLGKPVVATRCGGPTEMISDGWDGVLVPPSDDTALAQALLTLWREPQRCESLGQRARQRAEASFGAQSTAHRFASLFQELAQSPANGSRPAPARDVRDGHHHSACS